VIKQELSHTGDLPYCSFPLATVLKRILNPIDYYLKIRHVKLFLNYLYEFQMVRKKLMQLL